MQDFGFYEPSSEELEELRAAGIEREDDDAEWDLINKGLLVVGEPDWLGDDAGGEEQASVMVALPDDFPGEEIVF